MKPAPKRELLTTNLHSGLPVPVVDVVAMVTEPPKARDTSPAVVISHVALTAGGGASSVAELVGRLPVDPPGLDDPPAPGPEECAVAVLPSDPVPLGALPELDGDTPENEFRAPAAVTEWCLPQAVSITMATAAAAITDCGILFTISSPVIVEQRNLTRG